MGDRPVYFLTRTCRFYFFISITSSNGSTSLFYEWNKATIEYIDKQFQPQMTLSLNKSHKFHQYLKPYCLKKLNLLVIRAKLVKYVHEKLAKLVQLVLVILVIPVILVVLQTHLNVYLNAILCKLSFFSLEIGNQRTSDTIIARRQKSVKYAWYL